VTRRRGRNGSTARRLDLLWGSGERAARGPKPALTIEQVVSAAIRIADREGLGALTMRRVAEELGFTTMALYRYVPGKNELIDLMMDAAIGPPPPPSDEATGDWASELQSWARADLAIIRRHPWLLELVARAPQGPNWFAWFESALRALSGTGLTPGEMLATIALIDGHVRATAQVVVGMARAQQNAGVPNAWGAGFGAALERVVGDERFPTLTRIATSGGFEHDATPSDDDFEFGLRRLLDGIEAYIRSRPTSRHPRKAASGRKR
jgi:AcrR family transcriptional regulator